MIASFSVTTDDDFFDPCTADGPQENRGPVKVSLSFWKPNNLGMNEATVVIFDANKGCSKHQFVFSGEDFKFNFSGNFQLVGLPLHSDGAVGSVYFQAKRIPVTCRFIKPSQ